MLRRTEWNSLVSLSSLEPTEVPQTEHRYSYLFPVGSTSRRCLRTGRAVLHRGQKSSDASKSSNCDRLLIARRVGRFTPPRQALGTPCPSLYVTLSLDSSGAAAP